jgi:thioredoxin 1
MATVEITGDSFKETVKQGIVLIDWWADWCGPCRAFAPVYEAASDKNSDVVFGKIDTDEEQELAGAFQIRSIPTLMVFRDGILIFAQPGMLPAAKLDELIEKVRGLDMDEVRREIAEHKAAENQTEPSEKE